MFSLIKEFKFNSNHKRHKPMMKRLDFSSTKKSFLCKHFSISTFFTTLFDYAKMMNGKLGRNDEDKFNANFIS